ncbi:L-fucose dehydrogenase [Pedobacter sp. Leaf216]|uniref:aldo/keto reductase n=1 Tax=Pedobacter sp. Leaf216 TaxID=1735684 RepID=UPI0006FFECBB|nr:aldo/keto reductase [Pedobacter sp. Leaf216]KQM76999.1 L-fucose dehydrogenase [Pedobacter sp. Leaf216]
MKQQNGQTNNRQDDCVLPAVIFGTSSLGNLYQAIDDEVRLEIVEQCVKSSAPLTVFDTAGKYGAGLALESLGKCLAKLKADPEKVIISNKLGWYRMPLVTPEPTFEPGIWKNIQHDAVQIISYEGIMKCFEQGNSLLGDYSAQMVSVHDPDEYLFTGNNEAEYKERYQHILGAYRALGELKDEGLVTSVGVGAKDWKVIEMIARDVDLDWVMIANSLTVKSHPKALIKFVENLGKKNIKVINSAVFNGGFLTGGDFYNYQKVDYESIAGRTLLNWRKDFFYVCSKFDVLPAEACFNFSYRFPGVASIALNTTRPDKVAVNVALASKALPAEFWYEMENLGLIELQILNL